MQRLLPAGLWALVSLQIGAFLSQGDKGVQIFIHLDEFMQPILSPTTKRDVLTERLERVSRGVSQNDTARSS